MKNLVCFFLLLSLFSSCLCRTPKAIYPACYGVEYNSVRDSLGIVLLDSSWIPMKTWNGVTVWGPKEKQTYPRHGNKVMAYFNDTLYCESDSYGNGENYETVDGLSSVCIVVMYFYRLPRSGPWAGATFYKDSVGWICQLYDSPSSTDISKAQADSIIKAWGLKE